MFVISAIEFSLSSVYSDVSYLEYSNANLSKSAKFFKFRLFYFLRKTFKGEHSLNDKKKRKKIVLSIS